MAKNKQKYDDTLSEELENNIIEINELFDNKPLKCVDTDSLTDNKRCSNDSVNFGFCKKHCIDLSQHASACKIMCQKIIHLPFIDKARFIAYICEYILEYCDIFKSHEK